MTLIKKPTPYEAFTASKTNRHERVYSTRDDILDGKTFHKWYIGSTLGSYLGVIPLHSRRMGLILSLDTGLVSPKFHHKEDEAFDTVKTKTHHHPWKSQAGLYANPNLEQDGSTRPAQLARGAPTKTTSA